ncbi:MAG: peptide chain release factor N(5)-glutamine methyltransferase [Polyangiaceae bacterium]
MNDGSATAAKTPSARPETWTIASVLKWATDDFKAKGIERPRLDAEVLLAHALRSTRVQLVVDAMRPLVPDELARFKALVLRRRTREPVAYLLGEREFYGRTFKVDKRVLGPRPDTETLVDVALRRTESRSMSMRALDLCTGSGCVAITLAKERPTSSFVATDASKDALVVARENALRLGAYNVAFAEGDLFAAVAGEGPFELVTANPPYVSTEAVLGLMPDVRDFEPRMALDGGPDGLGFVRRILEDAKAFLAPGGVLALEIGWDQAEATTGLFQASGYHDVESTRDHARIHRVVSGACG